MPKFGPLQRSDLVHYLRQLGFTGPYSGGKHQFMKRDDLALRLPNPHGNDIDVSLLNRLLREAGIDCDEWEGL